MRRGETHPSKEEGARFPATCAIEAVLLSISTPFPLPTHRTQLRCSRTELVYWRWLCRAIPEPTLEARSRIYDPPPRSSGEAPYRALAEPQYECLVACASISARLQFVVG